MSAAPAFGDKVKVKVAARNGTDKDRDIGDVGVVTRVYDNAVAGTRSTVEVIFERAARSFHLGLDDVTTDLTWATPPQEQAILDAFAEVLRKERVGEQHGKRMRVARALLQAHDAGLKLHEEREQNRIAAEADRVQEPDEGGEG